MLFLSFDDNIVLKCQLELLIFVQVCRTIVKNYKSNIGSERTKDNKGVTSFFGGQAIWLDRV